MTAQLTRRTFVGGAVAAGSLAIVGCGERRRDTESHEVADTTAAAGGAGATVPALAAMTVYRDPSCGCCEAWAGLARHAGYEVRLVDHQDMPAIKRQQRVPESLVSCHTAVVGAYAIEGHVPLADVARLLKERPPRIRGIAVPGMPRGSPGMEMPDGSKDPFRVVGFDRAGATSLWREVT